MTANRLAPEISGMAVSGDTTLVMNHLFTGRFKRRK